MQRTPAGEYLSSMTWQDAGAALRRRPVGLLPIGAIEEHGPHLPLDTDVIIADATARATQALLTQHATPSLILPPIQFGVSFVGMSFPGTSPADPATFEAYLASVLTHAGRQRYRAILCCNAHLEPAHFERLHAACASAEAATGIPVRAPDHRQERFAAMLSEEFQRGSRHAGAYETSIVMAAKPEAVRSDKLQGLPAVWIDLPARLREGARTFTEAGASLGYFGDPATASAEEGVRLLGSLAEICLITLREACVELDGE